MIKVFEKKRNKKGDKDIMKLKVNLLNEVKCNDSYLLVVIIGIKC